MRSKTGSYTLIAVGALGLLVVQSLRPPSDFGDAVMRAAQGQQFFLKEPVYLLGLLVFTAFFVSGIVKLVRGT